MDNLILECRNWVIQNFKDFTQGDLKIPYVIKNPKNCGEIGTFNLGNLKITINSLDTYEKDLIICKKQQ